jgi:hypothetical protein
MTTDKKGKKTKDVKIDEELEEEVATVEEAAEEQKGQTPEEQVKALTESARLRIFPMPECSD